jgi:NTE family protein
MQAGRSPRRYPRRPSREKIVAELRRLLGPIRIENLRIPYVAVATDLVTGHEVWLQRGDLAEAMRASFALPGLFPPIEIEKRWLADGALVDPLPVAACRALGADMIIAVNLNTDIIGKSRRASSSVRAPLGFDPRALAEVNAEASLGPLSDSLTRGIFGQGDDRPNIYGVMTTSLSIMQDRLTRSRLAGDPPDLQITPRVGHIGLLEFERAEEAIREGEIAVERMRPELMDALQVMGLSASL